MSWAFIVYGLAFLQATANHIAKKGCCGLQDLTAKLSQGREVKMRHNCLLLATHWDASFLWILLKSFREKHYLIVFSRGIKSLKNETQQPTQRKTQFFRLNLDRIK